MVTCPSCLLKRRSGCGPDARCNTCLVAEATAYNERCKAEEAKKRKEEGWDGGTLAELLKVPVGG